MSAPSPKVLPLQISEGLYKDYYLINGFVNFPEPIQKFYFLEIGKFPPLKQFYWLLNKLDHSLGLSFHSISFFNVYKNRLPTNGIPHLELKIESERQDIDYKVILEDSNLNGNLLTFFVPFFILQPDWILKIKANFEIDGGRAYYKLHDSQAPPNNKAVIVKDN